MVLRDWCASHRVMETQKEVDILHIRHGQQQLKR